MMEQCCIAEVSLAMAEGQ